MTKTRIILLIFGALAFFMVAFTYFYARQAYPSSVCINTEQSRTLSPDGAYEAVLFERQCGENASRSAHISIFTAGTELENSFGNAVIVKGSAEDAFGPLSWSGTTINVALSSDDVLSVTEAPLPDVTVNLTRN